MDIVYGLLVVLHLLGMAAIVGSWLATVRTPRVLPGMVHGALLQLVTGLALVGLASSGVMGDEEQDEVNNTKIGVKLVVALVVAVLAFVNRKRGADSLPAGVFHAIGGLAVVNVLVAVLWS